MTTTRSPGRRAAVGLLLVSVAAVSGCFTRPDDHVDKMVCATDDNCPTGYRCAVPGVVGGCRKPGDVGSVADSSPPIVAGDADSGVGGTGGDAAQGAGIPDAPLVSIDTASEAGPAGTAKKGESCASGAQCAVGTCVDGICCESACQTPCFACAQLYTGKPDGTCAPIGTGKKDPHGACTDETATNQCGNDGYCDGAGACRKVGANHVCAKGFCSDGNFTPASTCDGKGACRAVSPTNCGLVACDDMDGCRMPCSTASDCPVESYCNASNQRCAAKKIDGDSCTGAAECTSGFCVDGTCCNTECDGKCMACSSALTTQSSGICSAVNAGTDPHDSCAVDASNECGNDGTCDGAGACRMTGTDHVCKPASCNAGLYTRTATCDGKGACGTASSQSCGAAACSPTSGCQTGCTSDGDCAGQSYCDTGSKSCVAKRDNGATCATAKACTSGSCIDGMCCNGPCNSPCSSCKKAHTNVADGTCASVIAGQDPYDHCPDESASNKCGGTGQCDGAGACQKGDKTQACGTASCNGSKYTTASICDGVGNCRAGTATDCGSFQCSATAGCLTTCTGNGDCSSTTYCDLTLAKPVCMPKGKPGDVCGTAGGKCATGLCVDGVCCSSTCTGSCYACNVAGKAGTCSAVTQGTIDPKSKCTVSGTTCGTNGKCDGNGSCAVAPAGTTGVDCRTACVDSASGSTLSSKSCDGKGACTGGSQPCDNIICTSDKTQCKQSCTADTDCTGGRVCSTDGKGMCAPICLYDDASSLFDDVCVFGP